MWARRTRCVKPASPASATSTEARAAQAKIVGQHVGALLRLAPARGDHHRDLGDAELPGGEYPGVARNQATVLAHQRRRRPAPLLDARRDRRDLGIRVGPSIFRVWDQPIDRPALDLVGRPRPLIFRAVSRAGARTRRRRGSVGGFELSGTAPSVRRAGAFARASKGPNRALLNIWPVLVL